MRFTTLLILLPLICGAAFAQQSASYELSESSFNAGGTPSQGSILASTSFRLTFGSVGETIVSPAPLASVSYRVEVSFGAQVMESTFQVDRDDDGIPAMTDCDDANSSVYPGAPPACDGLNNDCNDPSWPTPPADEADADGDSFGICAGDCDDTDPSRYPDAPEINDGKDNQCPGEPGYGTIDEIGGTSGFTNPADRHTFSWTEQAGATQYQVARSEDPRFGDGGLCQFVAGATSWSDPASPPAGRAFFYLVRAFAPHLGSWGQTSAGVERSACAPTFSFVDTPADDIAPDALYRFFEALQASPTDYILYKIDEPNLGLVNAWCSSRADFYRSNYLSYAQYGGIGNWFSQTWPKWWKSSATALQWAPVDPFAIDYYGALCGAYAEPYTWCAQSGLGGLPPRTVDPSHVGGPYPTCEILDWAATGCGDGTWRLTIRIAPTRQEACGF